MNAPDEIRVIHILRYAHALCGLEGIPSDWPDGHFWTDELDPIANCEECLAACKPSKTL